MRQDFHKIIVLRRAGFLTGASFLTFFVFGDDQFIVMDLVSLFIYVICH